MPRKSPFRIKLSADESAELNRRAAKYTLPYFEVVRAKMILMAADGMDNDEIAARLDTRREVVSQWRKRFFKRTIGGPGGASPPGTPSGLSPQSSPLRSRRWPANCRPPWACRCRDSAWPMWRGTPSARAWWRASATARCGAGCTRMRFAPGSTAAGSFPRSALPAKAGRILDLYERRWQGRHCARTSSSSPPTRRPASRRGCASIRVCHRTRQVDARGARVRAWRRLGLSGRPGRAPRQGVRPLRSNHRHRAVRALVDQVMSQPPYDPARRVFWIMDNGSSHRGEASVRRLTQAHPRLVPVHGPAELAQPDRDLLLHRPAQGAHAQ